MYVYLYVLWHIINDYYLEKRRLTISHILLGLPYVHIQQFGALHGKETKAAFRGHGLGDQSLSRAGRPEQQDSCNKSTPCPKYFVTVDFQYVPDLFKPEFSKSSGCFKGRLIVLMISSFTSPKPPTSAHCTFGTLGAPMLSL